MNVQRWIIILLWCPLVTNGMVEESGTLRGFLLDSCLSCAYDNWLSHVSERIIRFDTYNDYGPPNLDPITNGFGGFTYIPENAAGNLTLVRWRSVFEFALAQEWQSVDSILVLNDAEWNYELVHLITAVERRDYYILRERLDSSYVDANGDPNPANDVIGGFRNGWGVFVFNPRPRHNTAIVEVPHPEDDYMAPPVATELFIRAEFSILMIAGAGREVLWDSTSGGQYDNTLSLSDPSRNGRHPFQIAHEAAKDLWDTPPVSPFLAIQLHSYDHNEHAILGDMQVTAFYDDTHPNLPLRDVVLHRDFIHALPLFPISGFDGDEEIRTRIDEYISLWCDPQYSYYGDDTVALRSIQLYLGAPENQQGQYCHAEHDNMVDTENFVHIELDEYPDSLWSPTDFLRWLPGEPPARLANFRNVIDYYLPMIEAWDSALTWHEVPDLTPPAQTHITQVARNGPHNVFLYWDTPALDQHFDTYEIFYDTVEVTEASPSKTKDSGWPYRFLAEQTTTMQRIDAMPLLVERYRFAVRARDLLGNVSPFSNEWGIIDSVIHDVTIHVEGDQLRLNWSAQYYDSLFEIHKYPPGISDYTIIGTTDTNSFTFTPAITIGGATVLKVQRMVR